MAPRRRQNQKQVAIQAANDVEVDEIAEDSKKNAPGKKGKRKTETKAKAESNGIKKKKEIKEEKLASDENEDTEKGAKGKKGKRKMEKKGGDDSNDIKKKKKGEEIVEEKLEKTVIIKGKAPVDPECSQKVHSAHVFYEGNDVWDCMLNQTNLEFNNNKYYIIQLLEDDKAKSYSVWTRWGRVGKIGQNSLTPCGSDLLKAKSLFGKKFTDKTKNNWSDRSNFVKVRGKYDLLQMDYKKKEKETEEEEEVKVKDEKKLPPSTLNEKVKELMELIFNLQTMEDTVAEMKYDAKKAPLGKLTTDQIKAGYSALKKIEDLLKKNEKGKKLLQACNEFYTRIPHDFGMKRPPLIDNTEQLRQKILLLEALGDIQIAMKILSEECEILKHPVDRHYELLLCNLEPLEKGSADFKVIEKYLQNSHAKTHQHYSLKIEDIFCCEKNGKMKTFKDYGNRMLLWHGSRLSNWVGILGKGLQIAPPEAPVTGYMFGKGIYFADRSSKSANYCYASRSQNNGLLLLCEVSLGTVNELFNADYEGNKLPSGKHSVKGVGSVIPDPSDTTTLLDGTVVPLGKSVDAPAKNKNFSLNYNEYIVYDINQVRMRYLVKVKFQFK